MEEKKVIVNRPPLQKIHKTQNRKKYLKNQKRIKQPNKKENKKNPKTLTKEQNFFLTKVK